MNPQLRTFVCVGDEEVGKTSLLTVISKGKFPLEYQPVGPKKYTVAIEVKGEAIILELRDRPQNDDFPQYHVSADYLEVHAILLCFSIEWQDSLANIPKSWGAQARKFAPETPQFLVGCKKDLRTDSDTLQYLAGHGQVPVTYEQGEVMARTIGATYRECSALTGEGVRELLLEVTQRMDANRGNRPRKSSGCIIM
ncbi:hypothetical protein M408DRAFT_25394 [Serendipita vermifera MAFF 305830]|uniref:Uncharacterized protein n=1 Tax=Serendipita vermifera MAFF 305830 TaxID=933852 RepID=A0A0C2WJA3_SERVB|nr:hypothetical protein M408DRAFT_25394 [Serendipita vermifera MAFF 305830]